MRQLSTVPLIRSGLSLVASTVVSAGLGFLFWIVAARQYSAADIGLAAAAITAMILISDFAHIGLRTGLVRYIPLVGGNAKDLLIRSYVLAAVVSAIAGGVFLLGLDIWAPALIDLRSSAVGSTLFVLACAFWVLFLLEDSVLLALRQTPWVPVENGVFGLIKILMLFPLAGLAGWAGTYGVFVAWSLPVFAVVIVVNGAIWRYLDDQIARGMLTKRRSYPMREVLSYSLVDWSATSVRTGVIGVIPLIVLAQLGEVSNAYFFLAWTIAYSVYLLSANIGDALVTEASYEAEAIDRHTRHSALLSLAVSTPIVIVAVVGAPWILQAFGPEYAEGADTVLRLLLIGAIPNVVSRTYIGRLRAQKRMLKALGFESVLSIGVLGLSWIGLILWGIDGVGMAWLIALTLAAIYVVVEETVSWWGPRLRGGPARAIGGFLGTGERIRALTRRRQLSREVVLRLSELYNSEPTWRRLSTNDALQVVAVDGHEGRPPLRVELARNDWGSEALQRRVDAVSAVTKRSELASLRPLVPYPITHSKNGADYLVESTITGTDGSLPEAPGSLDDRVVTIVETTVELHRATSSWLALDESSIDHWITVPLRNLRETAHLPDEMALTVGRRLYSGFSGALVPSAQVHGNLRLSNTLFDSTGRLTGLLGWEWSEEGPVFTDWGVLTLDALVTEAEEDVGIVAASLLDDPAPFMNHRAFATGLPENTTADAMILYTWLHYLKPAVRAAGPRGLSRYWVARNVLPVINRTRALGEP
ncbi:MAG: phosphotransferase [Actinomycetota bacterium]